MSAAVAYEPRKGSVAALVLAWLRAQRRTGGGEPSAVEIGDALEVDSSRVSQALATLGRNGLVIRDDPDHGTHGARYRLTQARAS